MNMQALQQDTLLKGGAYRIEKILSQSDLEITYLSDKFGDNRNVVVTEFFVKDICRREKNNSVAYDSEDVATMRDKFKSDALDRLNNNDLREMGRATSTLLKELDKLNEKIIFIATTNLYKSFDKALIRRFDTVIIDSYDATDRI